MAIVTTIQQVTQDELTKLLEFSWRGTSFPTVDVHIDGSQDLAVHKYPNINSAKVESMGRNPYVITATCIFVNGLAPGGLESWDNSSLYPGVYAQFLNDMADSSIGILIHPFLGEIKCKPVTWKPHLDARFRGGEVVQAQWIETLDEDSASPVTNISAPYSNAAALDNIITSVIPDPTTLGLLQGITSFTDMMNSLQAIIDTADLNLKKALAFIASINYRIQSFLDSVNRLVNDTGQLLNPETYRNEVVKIAKGVYNTSQNIANNAKAIRQGTNNVISSNNNNKQAFNFQPSKADLIAQYNQAKANPRTTSGQLSAILLQIQNAPLFVADPSNTNNPTIDKEALAQQVLNSRMGASQLSGNTIWLLSQAANMATILQANLLVLQQQLGNKFNQQIGVYVTPSLTTMSSLSIVLMNSIEDLMLLNPLLNTPYIQAGTKVTFFK